MFKLTIKAITVMCAAMDMMLSVDLISWQSSRSAEKPEARATSLTDSCATYDP